MAEEDDRSELPADVRERVDAFLTARGEVVTALISAGWHPDQVLDVVNLKWKRVNETPSDAKPIWQHALEDLLAGAIRGS